MKILNGILIEIDEFRKVREVKGKINVMEDRGEVKALFDLQTIGKLEKKNNVSKKVCHIFGIFSPVDIYKLLFRS